MGFDVTERAKVIDKIPRMMPYKILVRELSKDAIDKMEIERKFEDQSDLEVVEFEAFRPECAWGEVIVVGKGKWFKKRFITPECKPGDIIAYNKNFEDLKLFIGESRDFHYIMDYGDCLLIYRPEE